MQTNQIPIRQALTDRYLLRMLARFVTPYWKQLMLVFLMLLGVTGLSLLPPYLIQRSVDGPITEGNLAGLIPYAVFYFLCIPALFVLRFGHIYLLQTVGQSALMNLRQTLFEHILKQDMRFFNKTPVGQIVSRLSSDIEALTELLSTSIVIVISNLITLVGIVIVMFVINWRLALISLVVLPIMTGSTIYFRTSIRQLATRLHKLVADYQAFLNEQFGGMLIVQLFGRQHISRREFDTLNAGYRDIHNEMRDQYTAFSSVLQMLSVIGLAMVLYGGGQGLLAGWATLGMLISFIQYSRRSFEPIMLLSEQFTQIQTALSAADRIARMLSVEPEIVERPQTIPLNDREKSVTFEKVEFSYEPGTPVLRDVSVHISAGQRVAIVGATGAGKTSLAGLIARFYDVTSGQILINGIDVRDLSIADLRKHVMVVPQNPYCFNGTIADNLRLFDPTITDEQMIAAAKTACAAPFIERLPGGYDYMLLPGAANLSQGQRQLLALARALIHNPDSILVLDEATSNIDTETETLIQMGLQQVLQNRTSLIIAHRLSTVRDADRILVMKHGQIVEDGTHETLLRQNGLYTRLYQRQFQETNGTAQLAELTRKQTR
ncbi:MAG: ABC transporter ATP-binding protein/permease [Anaerolineae bacterium]|jgi:ATP-binding cassette subfamily B protein|nr:ABC transporter ATP-binding protein/permease [Anaerolineae bacterium]